MTCTQKRRLPDPVPTISNLDDDLHADSEIDTDLGEPPSVLSKRHRRHCQCDNDVQQSLSPWTPAFLAACQAEDEDLSQVQNWL